MVLAVTGNSFMVLDPKSYALKYRVDLTNLEQISLSPYSDALFVMHVKPVSEALVCMQASSVESAFSTKVFFFFVNFHIHGYGDDIVHLLVSAFDTACI